MVKLIVSSITGAAVGVLFPVLLTYVFGFYMHGDGNEVSLVLFYTIILTAGLGGGFLGALVGDSLRRS